MNIPESPAQDSVSAPREQGAQRLRSGHVSDGSDFTDAALRPKVGEELGINANLLCVWRKLVPAGHGGGRRRSSRAQSPICKANWRRPTVNCVTHESRSPFKKNIGHSLRTVLERYERIDAMKNEHAILRLCQELEVSASGY